MKYRELRKKHNETQADVAGALSVSQSLVSKFEAGKVYSYRLYRYYCITYNGGYVI